jgi:hypothetical protein
VNVFSQLAITSSAWQSSLERYTPVTNEVNDWHQRIVNYQFGTRFIMSYTSRTSLLQNVTKNFMFSAVFRFHFLDLFSGNTAMDVKWSFITDASVSPVAHWWPLVCSEKRWACWHHKTCPSGMVQNDSPKKTIVSYSSSYWGTPIDINNHEPSLTTINHH